MFNKKIYSKMLSVFLAGLFLLTGAMPTKAAPLTSPLNAGVTFIVNSTLDQPDDLTIPGTCHTAANTCTLRAAIMQANRTSGVGATIIIPAGMYNMTIPADALDGEENGDLNLTTPISGTPTITISGAGADATFIDANQLDRVFKVDTGRTATISGITIMNGYVSAQQYGGGIYNNGTLTVTNSTISGNSAALRGGGIYNYSSGIVTITNSLISGNSAENGGGIQNYSALTITNSIISENSALYGGGIRSSSYPDDLTITNSTISGNSATYSGGGVLNEIIGITKISNSTISGNSAKNGGGIGNFSSHLLTVTNSTLTGNQASVHGGGIWNDGTEGTTHVYIYNTSIVFNAADMDEGDALIGEGGGTYNKFSNSTFFHLTNSLIAGNTAGSVPVYDDCFGTLYTQGNNLIGAASVSPNGDSCTIDQVYGDYALLNDLSLLSPLQNNGGSTETVALLSGSNAIDSGTPTYGCVGHDSVALSTDQRGAARPQGSQCDIGAYEAAPSTIATFTSIDTQDGQILETTETSGKGGTLDSTATKINIGDDAANKQYRAILSFDTSSLPDDAIITSVTLKFKYAGKTGTLPFSTHGNLLADIRKGPFSNNATLQTNDFKAAASKNSMLSFTNSMINNWFSQSLAPANFQYINLTNVTQFRLRFQTDDNHDFSADLLKIFSSNAGASGRPKLIIEYYIP